MKRFLLLFLALTSLSIPCLGAPTTYPLQGKDKDVRARVLEAMIKAKPGDLEVPTTDEELVRRLESGETFALNMPGTPPKELLICWTEADALVAKARGSVPRPTPLPPPVPGAMRPQDPFYPRGARPDINVPAAPRYQMPEEFSRLKTGKVKLDVRSLETGSKIDRTQDWWGWEREYDHLKKTEITVLNVSKMPSTVTVEFFWIGNEVGKSGGSFGYGLGTKEFTLASGQTERFNAETVAKSSRWSSWLIGRGSGGTKVEGWMVRLVETVEGKRRITNYKGSMPHMEKYINIKPHEIAPDSTGIFPD